MIKTPRELVCRLTGLTTLLSVAIISTGACQSRTRVDSSAIAQFVLAQALIDRMAVGLPTPRFGPEAISVELIDSLASVRVFRVTPWILEHWHPYLVAASDRTLHGLGGFPAPDAIGVLSVSSDGLQTSAQVRTFTKRLARLLDPNGSGEVVFSDDSLKTDELKIAWRRAAREGFLSDTTVRNGSNQVVRLTALSHLSRQYPAAWQRVTFAFELSQGFQLLRWSMQTGQPTYAVESK